MGECIFAVSIEERVALITDNEADVIDSPLAVGFVGWSCE